MTEPSFNQYAAPVADVADMAPETGYAVLNFFSADSRVGRLRYLAYVMGAGLLCNIVQGVFLAISPTLGAVMNVLLIIPVIWFCMITAIKRAHDFDANGWWSLATLIPLLGALVFALIPGSSGANRYGPKPPANTWGVRVLAAILPASVIIGIAAAIVIPQYAAYTAKARAAQQAHPTQPAQPN